MMNGLQPYPAYKESGVPWLGEIPSHWEVLPNRAVFFEVNQRNFPDEQLLSVTIAQGVIKQSDLLKGSTKKDSSNEDKTKYKLVKPGDIVYNKMRAWQSAIGLSKERGIVSPAYLVIHLRDNKDEPKYFHYLFRIPNFAKEAERWSYGITSDQWSLRIEDFKQIYVSIPSKLEQINIVKTLNFFDKQIFDLILRKKQLIKLLLEQKKAIIHQAVTRGLDPSVPMKPSGIEYVPEIPENWEILPIKRLFISMDYGISCNSTNEGKIPVLTMGNVNDGIVKIPENGGIGYVEPHFLLETGDLLYNRTNSSELVGKVGLFKNGDNNKSITFASYLVRLRCNSTSDSEYINYLLNSKVVLSTARQLAVPSLHQSNLNPTKYGRILIPIPSMEEQLQIASKLNIICQKIGETIEYIKNEMSLIQEYRSRLITDVVTGKLDVRHLAASLPDLEDIPLDEPLEEEPEEEFTDEEE